MSLVLAHYLPHPPTILAPLRDHGQSSLTATAEAVKELTAKIKNSGITTLVVISAHGERDPKKITMLTHESFRTDLLRFGDLSEYKLWPFNWNLAAELQAGTETSHRLVVSDEDVLDYGTAIPLTFLSTIENLKVVPLRVSGASEEEHWHFGSFLKDKIMDFDERVGIVATGNLSHIHLDESEVARRYDNTVLAALRAAQYNDLIAPDTDLVTTAKTCGLKPLLILLGALKGVKYETEIVTYEIDSGIGYLTAEFIF
ncbi:MAG: AmmeMemoRadiSam system protein B [Candidatus Komeilibacteria bacterium]|nr:AmmeMemoRadiSam system protein B [Candidatus Komeilibacteria bacterium]